MPADSLQTTAIRFFEVDDTCIACVTCVSLAPTVFVIRGGNEKSCVVSQPEYDSAEYRQACEAMGECPVDAIRLVPKGE